MLPSIPGIADILGLTIMLEAGLIRSTPPKKKSCPNKPESHVNIGLKNKS